jgi:uncharacterized protein YuzE
MLATKINDSIIITGKVNGIEISQTYQGLTIWEAIKLFIKETASFAKQ